MSPESAENTIRRLEERIRYLEEWKLDQDESWLVGRNIAKRMFSVFAYWTLFVFSVSIGLALLQVVLTALAGN